MTDPSLPTLHPDALMDLRKSGLSDATLARCGLHSVRPADLRACPIPGVVHALSFPYFALDGSPLELQRWKLFYEGEPGDKPKYWQEKGSDPLPYVPPLADWQGLASDPTQPLLMTEGEKKALVACQSGLPCIGLAGVWNWRAKLDSGERLVLPGLDQFIWQSRTVELVPDSDAWRPEKEMDILSGFYALAMELKERGASVAFVELPDGSLKRGFDDFLAQIPAFQRETFADCKRDRLDDPRFKALAAWHQKWEKRQRHGGDVGLVKELADEILHTDHFAKDAGGQLYVFEGGCYRPHGEARIARQVKRLLALNGDTARWSSHRAREVAEYLRVDMPDLWERPPSNVLNLKNGLFDVTADTLSPHSPGHLSPVQLPVAFDPAATCPLWESFAARVLPSDCQTLPVEVVASAMRGEITDQTAVLLVGSGENGKSTLLEAVIAFLGRENVSTLSLQRLEDDKFAVVRLLGKLANVCADLPSDHLAGTSIFKALTGGDRLTAERKFQGSFEFSPFARLLFSTNHYPSSKDASHAFFRRWLVIPFDAVLDPREKIPNLAARLATPGELSGVLNRALAVLPGLLKRGGFTHSESTQAALMEFREMTDPLAAWLDRFTVLSPDGMVSKKDLAISYNAASETANRPSMTSKAFLAAVRRLRPTIKDGQRRISGEVKDVFLGLAFASQSPTTTSQVSAVSAHSGLFSQISLGEMKDKEDKEERVKAIKIGNELNELTELTGASVLPSLPQEALAPCFACHGTSHWQSIHGAVVCGTCHPPISPSLVAEWVNGLPPGERRESLTRGQGVVHTEEPLLDCERAYATGDLPAFQHARTGVVMAMRLRP